MEMIIEAKKTLDECFKHFEEAYPQDVKNRAIKVRVQAGRMFLRNLSADSKEFARALECAIGTGERGAGAGPARATANPKAVILAAMVEKGVMTAMDCFIAFKKGPEGMREIMKYAVRSVKPEDRVWISYDEKNDTYIVEAKGENPPDGWRGYLPIIQAAELDSNNADSL